MSKLHRAVIATALLALTSATFAAEAGPTDSDESDALTLRARRQIETAKGSGRYHSVIETIRWAPKKTAIVVCDMWDRHWCKGATRRVGEMAPRMNEVIAAARKRGVLIIHCPSGTMGHYKDAPQRKLAQGAPKVATKIPLERWCSLNRKHEAALPIRDSDGGCDCQPVCRQRKAWSKQIDAIKIVQGDAITDSAQAFYLMKQRGIVNVIVMGVHTNMCVLGRPFSVRQMIYQGQNVVLMRDMTDTMYNPRSKPYVSHFTGTDLVVEHIERHWCPTITSVDFLGGRPLRFTNDKRPHVAIVMAEREYRTEESLPPFALSRLGKEFKLSYVYANEKDRNDLPGINVLDDADLAIISVRRRVLPIEQMAVIRKFIAAGKPIIGLRTASHAFSLRGKQPPKGYAAWDAFDAEILGGHYTGHHGNGSKSSISIAPGAAKHPILRGVDLSKLIGNGSLYQSSPLAKTAKAILTGSVPGKPAEPVAWTNIPKNGGRVFYTSLGHVDDFKQPAFLRLMENAVYWALKKSPPQGTTSK